MIRAQRSIWSGFPTINPALGVLGIGVLAGGYVVDYTASDMLDLWDCNGSFPVLVDSLDPAPWSVIGYPGFATSYGNDTGSLILAGLNAGAYGFGRVTASGGALSLTFTTNAGITAISSFDVMAAGDGTDSAVVYDTSAGPAAWTTTTLTGSTVGSYTPASGASNEYLAYHPRSDRIVTHDKAGGTVYLRDSSGTAIDSISIAGTSLYRWTACGPDRTACFQYDGSTSVSYRVLDTASDVLSWVAAAQTFASTHDIFPYAWDGHVVVAAPAGERWKFLDPIAGDIATGPDIFGEVVNGDFGLPRPLSLSRTYAAVTDYTPSPSHLLALPPTFLRQRQSPRATPSRVRGPNLRQRQTPYVN